MLTRSGVNVAVPRNERASGRAGMRVAGGRSILRRQSSSISAAAEATRPRAHCKSKPNQYRTFAATLHNFRAISSALLGHALVDAHKQRRTLLLPSHYRQLRDVQSRKERKATANCLAKLVYSGLTSEKTTHIHYKYRKIYAVHSN